MITKYDGYFQKELPYKMNLEELFERSYDKEKDWFHYSEQDFLAYVRQRGEKFTFFASIKMPKQIIKTPYGPMPINHIYSELIPCKICLDSEDAAHNPISKEFNGLDRERNSWYHAYKIQITTVEDFGFPVKDTMYVSDFISHFNRGKFFIAEVEV